MRRRILLTAFEPFGGWPTNASQLCLQALLPQVPGHIEVFSRVYPVDFRQACEQLEDDLSRGFDYTVHLGQAQQSGRLRLEAIAVNVGGLPGAPAEEFNPLAPTGPVAYQTRLPLSRWVRSLQGQGIPACISYHAGTFLCNAVFYWAQQCLERSGSSAAACLIHVPLDVSQLLVASGTTADLPALPAATSAAGVRWILEDLAGLAET